MRLARWALIPALVLGWTVKSTDSSIAFSWAAAHDSKTMKTTCIGKRELNLTWKSWREISGKKKLQVKEFHVGCRMVRELNATNRMLRRQWNYGRQGSSFLKVGRRKDDAFPLAYLRGPISQPRSELCGASVTNNLFLENCRKHMFKWKQSSDDGKIEKKRSKRLNDF